MRMIERLKLNAEQRYLFDILKPYKRVVFIFLFGSLLASLLDGISIGLLIPLLYFLQGGQSTVDLPRLLQGFVKFLESYPMEEPLILSIGFVVLAVLFKNVLLGISFKQGVWLSNRVNGDVRLMVMKRLMTVGIDFHYKSKIGELIEKTIQYTHWIKDLFVFSVQFIVFSLILLILISLLVMLSWPLTLFALPLGIAAVMIISCYIRRLSHYGKRTAKTSRELTQTVQESLSAVKLIQSYGKEQHQILKLGDKIEDQVTADNRLTFRILWVQPITEGLGVIAIGILLVGSTLILPANDQLVLPQFLPFVYILIRIVTTLKILNDARSAIIARWPYLRLVYDLAREDNKPFIPDGHLVFPGLQREIGFDSVSFSYEDEKTVLDRIYLTIPRGKTTAIVGKSGTGKSTLVDLLLRFYDPQQGSIRIDDQPLPDFQLASYRRKVGVVSQETFIFNETVKFNIAFGMDESVSEDLIIEAAQKAGAHQFILELADGYNTVLGDRGVTLSGGQRQRIAIARAVLKNPEILILDEATSSLDTVTERQIHDNLFKLCQNRTLVIIAHRPSTVKNVDQVIVLKNGRVVEAGKPQHLLHQKGEYYDLMHVQ